MIPTPNEIFTRIKDGSLLHPAVVVRLDHDSILDERDGDANFDTQWMRCYNQIEDRWRSAEVNQESPMLRKNKMTVLQLCGFAIAMALGVQSYCMSQEPVAAPLPDFPLIEDASTLTASERALVELKTMHGAPEAYLNLKRKMLPSFGDSINWSVAELSESVPLTDKEIKVLEDALAKRKSAKSSNLRDACLRSLEVDITKKDVALKLESDFAKSEFNSEKKLLETIDELLPPKKCTLLVIHLISSHTLSFVNIQFVKDHLQLTAEQVRCFNEVDKYIDECSRQQVRKGLDASDLRAYKDITKKLAHANETLSIEQFEYWARACKLMPLDATIKDFLKTSTKEQKEKLILHRPSCADILGN